MKPAIRGIRLLTRAEFEAIPEAGKARRRAHWQGIIRGLQVEHERQYRGAAHAAALSAAFACEVDSCRANALSGSGLCAQHLHKARTGDAA